MRRTAFVVRERGRLTLPAQPANRVRHCIEYPVDGAPRILEGGQGLAEDFEHPVCGCPGTRTWKAVVYRISHVGYFPPRADTFQVEIDGDHFVQHSQACRRGA